MGDQMNRTSETVTKLAFMGTVGLVVVLMAIFMGPEPEQPGHLVPMLWNLWVSPVFLGLNGLWSILPYIGIAIAILVGFKILAVMIAREIKRR
jgi:hypothetical protein